MDRQLTEALRRGHGVVTGIGLPKRALDNAVRAGHLLRLFPGIYADAGLLMRVSAAGNHQIRCRAAVLYTRGTGAVSHMSALAIYGFLPPPGKVHVTVESGNRQRATRGIAVHHHFPAGLKRTTRGGVIVTTAAEAVVYAFPLMRPEPRIGCVMEVITANLASTAQIRRCLESAPRLPGRGQLSNVLAHIDGGCRSLLEIYGADRVFSGTGFRHLKRQHLIRIDGRTFYLDAFAESEAVDFELDGAAFHGNAVQRERDLKRDALLATAGILVVRFSYARLMTEPDAVRAEALRILATRRSHHQPSLDPDPWTRSTSQPT